MKTTRQRHLIIGWGLFIIALIVYTLTLEPTASFWDSSEFIAASYKLEIPHPPGAPFYMLVGKMFSFFALGDLTQIAFWVNMVSAVSSALTIMLLYWIIVMLGRKAIKTESKYQFSTLALGGIVGALAYSFTDSFWFSAVEAEVYAMSSFLMALVVWAALKWDSTNDQRMAAKWFVFIAYVVGLSIGVHPLNLLAIPALGLIYYFKKFEPSTKGILMALSASGVMVLVLMYGLRIGMVGMAREFEIFSVNQLGLPFGFGAVAFVILLVAGLAYGLIFSIRKKKHILNTALIGTTYLIIGFASYGVIIIRSNFDPPLDPNNPQNLPAFVSYLNLEQYPTRPLFHGQDYTADIIDQKYGKPIYRKGKDKYEIAYRKIENIYDPGKTRLMPRIYSQEDHHIAAYKSWLNLKENEHPTTTDNLSFLTKYQIGHMYLRYFLWNFSGKAGDEDGSSWLAAWEDDSKLPASLSANKGRNNYYMLPLILGLIGLFFSYKRDIKIASIITILFLATGFILVLYLNSPSAEPRERDYIYVASFFAFAIWIGFGAMALLEQINRYIQKPKLALVLAGIAGLSVPGILLSENWDDHDRSGRYYSVDAAINTLESCPPNAILFSGGDNDTYSLWYAQEVENVRTDVRVIVTTYFSADWNIEQLTRQANESAPLPFSFDHDDFKRGTNDYVYLMENPKFDTGVNLKEYLRLVKKKHQGLLYTTEDGVKLTTTPTRKFLINTNSNDPVLQAWLPKDKMTHLKDSMELTIKGHGMSKGDLMLLDLIAHNNWERPICFTFTGAANFGIEFQDYLLQQGQTYRLTPIKNPDPQTDFIDTDAMYSSMMVKSQWRGLDNPEVFYNEYYRNQVRLPRMNFNSLANDLIVKGEKEKAAKVLMESLTVMPDDTIPYDISIARTVDLLNTVGEIEQAASIADLMMDRANETFHYLIENNAINTQQKIRENLVIMNVIANSYRKESKENENQVERAIKYSAMFSEALEKFEQG